jgi:DNA-binding NarL/FixJ family response regulator
MTTKISILIGDDHELVRDALAHLLRSNGDFTVSVAQDEPSVLAEVAAHGFFDVLLLDIQMPGMDGLVGVEKAVLANKGGAVVIFSGQVDNDFVSSAIQKGAKGYIPKTFPLQALTSALGVIAAGQIFLPISQRSDAGSENSGYNLTDREKAILRKVSNGMPNKEIARITGITEPLVKMHMRNICIKLKAKNRTHAAMIARRMAIE